MTFICPYLLFMLCWVNAACVSCMHFITLISNYKHYLHCSISLYLCSAYIYSQTSMTRPRMTRSLWMPRTRSPVPAKSFFILYCSNTDRSNTDRSHSRTEVPVPRVHFIRISHPLPRPLRKQNKHVSHLLTTIAHPAPIFSLFV